eukprot:10135508-Alexandrium_andersonii.AAC.1
MATAMGPGKSPADSPLRGHHRNPGCGPRKKKTIPRKSPAKREMERLRERERAMEMATAMARAMMMGATMA